MLTNESKIMSGNEPIKLNFGKKSGQIELKKDRGIQENAFNENKNALSIFTQYDKDQNNILDEKELQQLYKDIENAAGKNKKLTAAEAVKFLKSLGIENVKAKDARGIIKSFIDTIGGEKDTVVFAEVTGDTIVVRYNNGIDKIYIKNDEGKAVLQKEICNNEKQYYVYTYENDGKTLNRSSVTDYQTNTTTVITYENGKPVKTFILKNYSSDDISFGTELIPEATQRIGTTKDANDNIIKQDFLNKDVEVIGYREFSENGKVIVQKDAQGNETARFEMDKNCELAKTIILKDYSPNDISVGTKLIPGAAQQVRITKDANDNITQEFLDTNLNILATREISADGKTIVQKDAQGNETARFEMDKNNNWEILIKKTFNGKDIEFSYNQAALEDWVIHHGTDKDGNKIKRFEDIPKIKEKSQEERTPDEQKLLNEFDNLIKYVIDAGVDYGVDPNLIIAIIQKETISFKSSNSSAGGGYMQLTKKAIVDILGGDEQNDGTIKWGEPKINKYGKEMETLLTQKGYDIYCAKNNKEELVKKIRIDIAKDSEFNIRVATLYFRYILNDKNGDVKKAARKYNGNTNMASNEQEQEQDLYARLVAKWYNEILSHGKSFIQT